MELNLNNPEPLHSFQEYFIAKNLIGRLNVEYTISQEILQLEKRIEMFENKYPETLTICS